MAQYSPERAEEIADNIASVQSRMNDALLSITNAQKAQLVAVSKYKPASDILAAYEKAGHRHFGENYLPSDIKWHFIGTLQSNKCKTVAGEDGAHTASFHTMRNKYSAKKASTLDKACAASRSEPLRIFLQVNTSAEETKSGMLPREALDVARHVVSSCAHLKLAGLMTIGSPNPDLENGENPDFKTLNECRAIIQETLKIDDLELSMGMSDDFPQALLQGSTNIRVGSTVFGSRPPFTKST
ncbi:hypothetical protein BG006_010959 [Podila minutissima]|uniref:Pyridoxal phosphate homeostasis protein n=1 Tax=Podila minutissima TaxID=64525 RepID=A0A9P5VI79_9FUNG|nr:hypothetical protein BG006_010959 [Podila minutissima]